MEVGAIQNRKYALVTAYINGTLNPKDIELVEERIGESQELKEYYSKKIEEQKFIQQLIPNIETSKKSMKTLRSEVMAISDQVFPKEKKTLLGRIKNILDKPVFTIEY